MRAVPLLIDRMCRATAIGASEHHTDTLWAALFEMRELAIPALLEKLATEGHSQCGLDCLLVLRERYNPSTGELVALHGDVAGQVLGQVSTDEALSSEVRALAANVLRRLMIDREQSPNSSAE